MVAIFGVCVFIVATFAKVIPSKNTNEGRYTSMSPLVNTVMVTMSVREGIQMDEILDLFCKSR